MLVAATTYYTNRFDILPDFVDREVSIREWQAWQADYVDGNKRPMPVSTANADRNVWGGVTSNAIFRFWHDLVHLDEGLNFDYHEEVAVGLFQMEQVRKWGFTEECIKLIEAETIGQVLYHQVTGQFPADQIVFAKRYFAHGMRWFGDGRL